MHYNPKQILTILDACCDDCRFPMLDNGYFYLAASRLSLYRSAMDWALVIETFGYSPRVGLPGTYLQTFASRLHNRDAAEHYVNRQAYENYLANNPNNEFRAIHPISEGPWQDAKSLHVVADGINQLLVRDRPVTLPPIKDYASHGVVLEDPRRVQVFELCRCLADVAREQVLATPQERRISVPPNLKPLLQLEEWRHPDFLNDEYPSGCESFRQLAEVLVTGDVLAYNPTQLPNNHWRHWPGGGRL